MFVIQLLECIFINQSNEVQEFAIFIQNTKHKQNDWVEIKITSNRKRNNDAEQMAHLDKRINK